MAEGLTVSAGHTITVMSGTDAQVWYTRREGRTRGPYSAEHVTRYILLGRIRLGDELSSDQCNWRPVTECEEFLPWITGGESGWDDYQRLTMARISIDERRSERRRNAGEGTLPPGMKDRRQGADRRQLDKNLESFVLQLMSDGTAPGERGQSQPLRPWLLATLLITLVVAWFSTAFR